ncbi:redoxin domain-containing protein [Sulfobacillus sp. DSM 109850]|uniref:Redoxin domain-containing protein n=3 Tax=Sulfobacillus harzensis TaxID=2729629 RepID=A0A7Y0L0J4_9FIRM|nr:redoxin domain-containing protein [Sulfobacillus harzensis]
MPAFNRALPEFNRLNAQVLGISVDSEPTNTAWMESLGGLDYPLLSDFWPHGEVLKKYGLLRSEGYAERAVIVIDKEGVIRYIDVHNIAEAPDPQEAIKALEGLA